MCVVQPPVNQMKHKGQVFTYFYDSGAECSFIKESVASNFSGKRFNKVVSIIGIGQYAINSTMQILSLVTIDENDLEILFHVVPDCYLTHSILIGREILNQGFSVLLTSNKVTLAKINVVESCAISNPVPTDWITGIDTDIPSSEKFKLISLLNEFYSSLIQGIPRKRVTTGQLEIRLIDPNRTVQR